MPKGVYERKPFTEEHKRKISEALKRRKEEFGYINSPETRRKMSEVQKIKIKKKELTIKMAKKPLTIRQKTYKSHNIKIGDFRPIAGKNTKYCSICGTHGKKLYAEECFKKEKKKRGK